MCWMKICSSNQQTYFTKWLFILSIANTVNWSQPIPDLWITTCFANLIRRIIEFFSFHFQFTTNIITVIILDVIMFSKNLSNFNHFQLRLIYIIIFLGKRASRGSKLYFHCPKEGVHLGLNHFISMVYSKLHIAPTHEHPYNILRLCRVELGSVWLYAMHGMWWLSTEWIRTLAPRCFLYTASTLTI